MNIYRHKFAVRCPNNDASVVYELELRSCRTIMVESIVEACASFGVGFQEEIADRLLHTFGGQQIIRAHHHGVDIETRRGFV